MKDNTQQFKKKLEHFLKVAKVQKDFFKAFDDYHILENRDSSTAVILITLKTSLVKTQQQFVEEQIKRFLGTYSMITQREAQFDITIAQVTPKYTTYVSIEDPEAQNFNDKNEEETGAYLPAHYSSPKAEA